MECDDRTEGESFQIDLYSFFLNDSVRRKHAVGPATEPTVGSAVGQ